MLFFSKFNKNKKDEVEELNEKILELENIIGRKSKEISDLINEIEKTNRTIQFENVTKKQIELFEKNLKDAREENLRLKNSVSDYEEKILKMLKDMEVIKSQENEKTKLFEKRVFELEEENKNLKELKQKEEINLSRVVKSDKVDELEEVIEKNNKLKNIIRDKDEKILKLSDEIKKLENNIQYNDVTEKQIGLFEKNIKDVRDENSRLKKFIQEYKLILKKEKIDYKIPVELFYNSTKFKPFIEYLEKENIKFIQELSFGKFDIFDDGIKSMEEARQKWENYNSYKIIDWDTITYLKRGERVNKIYNRNRKFVTFLNDNGIEFMDDLETFEFETLKKVGFDSKSIEELKEKKEQYYKEYRIVK